MSLIYLSKYNEIKNIYTLDYQHIVVQLMKPNEDDDTGLVNNGYIIIENPKLQLTDSGYTIIGILKDNKSDLVLILNENIDLIQLTLEHYSFIRWDIIFSNDGKKILISQKISEHVNRYLVNERYNNVVTIPHDIKDQSQMVYIRIKNNYTTDQDYKLHISCKISKWKECYNKLLYYMNENQEHICQIKFGLLSLVHTVDYSNDLTRDYLEWNDGASSANFIIYFKSIASRRMSQFEFISEFLSQFIPYWCNNDFDNYVAREQNVLSFNERLTKSLFITYDSDTSTKIGFVSENEDKTINDKLTSYNGKTFMMSDELKKEKEHICSVKDIKKLTLFNDCLKYKYNLSVAELCHEDINNAHAWKKLYAINDETESINIERCYNIKN